MKVTTPNPALLPSYETLLRGENAFTAWRRELNTIRNKKQQIERRDDDQMSDGYVALCNQLSQSELRLMDDLSEIVATARRIVSEADNAELLTTCNCLNRDRNLAEAAADAAIGNGEYWEAAPALYARGEEEVI